MGMVETGTGRPDRDAEDLGNGGGVQALEMAQHEQDPLLRWKASKAPLELVPVGDAQVVVVRVRDVHRQDAKVGSDAAFARRLGKAGADDESVEPGVKSVRIAESRQVTPGDHQRFLEGILGPIGVPEDPLREREESIATDTDQVGIGLPITAPCRLDENAIHGLRTSIAPSGGAVRPLWEVGYGSRSIFEGQRAAEPDEPGAVVRNRLVE